MSPKSCGAWIVEGVLHNNPSRVVISQSQDPASRVKLPARDWCDEYMMTDLKDIPKSRWLLTYALPFVISLLEPHR
jgi:hypothetical protein